jgi:hypothetical protein
VISPRRTSTVPAFELLPVASVVVYALPPLVIVVYTEDALGEMTTTEPDWELLAVTTVEVVGAAPAVV